MPDGVPGPGAIVDGKYEVERLLGVGGMGVVVSARHRLLGQRVAIKFMRPEVAYDASAVERFLREARASVALSSEHAARVIDVATLESGAPYIVMEHLTGVDLSQLVRSKGPLPVATAVDYVSQACVALVEAHGLGIVHRDLKPANLFLAQRTSAPPLVKVLDFGISKLNDATAAEPAQGLTASGVIMGSPAYMSPEQVRSARAVDPRSDVWSLGVILYELLTGICPFQGETLGDTFAKIVSEAPPPLRAQRPEVPVGLDAVIQHCLQRNPASRIQSVGELASRLRPFASNDGPYSAERRWSAGPVSSGTLAAPEGIDSIGGAGAGTEKPWLRSGASPIARPTRPWIPLALGAGLVVAAAGVGVLYLGTSPAPTVPSASSSVAAAAAACAPDATRCSGGAQQTCDAKAGWVTGPITAGRCGAVCTPGSSPARCEGSAPQTCASSGQWETGAPCPAACRDGACVGECVPGRTQCSGAAGVQTCGPDGEWQARVLCAGKRGACREGACVQAEPPLPPGPAAAIVPPPPKPDCDPPFTLDDQGQKHFKHECYPK